MKKYIFILLLFPLLNNVKSQCNPPSQELCMVTADTILHTYAVVVWEKVVTDEIDSFFIYRKNAFGLYDKIGATHYSDPGEFWDYGVNLGQNLSGLYKYKISTLDTCGNESLKSNFHKPIHLIYTGLGNFQYDDYEIEFITPNYFFELYVDFTGAGNTWQVINSVPPGTYDMQDFGFASHPLAVYHVRATLPTSCDPTRAGINTSRSNIKNQSIVNGWDEFESIALNVYPNPASDQLNLDFKPGLNIESVEVYNAAGSLVKQVETTSKTLQLNGLLPGIYQLRFHTNAGILSKKIVKEL